MYKLSKSNKIWQISSDSYIIFNSISDAVININLDIYNFIQNCQWNKIPNSTIKKFLDSYILIPNDVNDKEIIDFEIMNAKTKKDRLGVFIVPSRVCNLECTYCMQNNLFSNKNNTYITKEVIDKYFEWTQHKINKWGVSRFDLVFYGGEPLTTDISILNYLFKKFDSLSIKPIYGMITNGVNLLQYFDIMPKMSSLQITLDGNREAHDKRRIFKNGSGTFDIIINNIIQYLAKSKSNEVTLRMNIDKYNRDRLIDDLKEITMKLPMEQVLISLNPVDPYSPGITDEIIHGDIQKTAIAIANAQDYLKKEYGTEPHIWRLNCGVLALCQWSFDTEGSIYKCPAYTGEPSRAVSNVDNDYLSGSFYKLLNKVNYDDECLNCSYIGHCYGGCIRQKELTGTKSCKKEFFDEYIPRMIELKYNINNTYRKI